MIMLRVLAFLCLAHPCAALGLTEGNATQRRAGSKTQIILKGFLNLCGPDPNINKCGWSGGHGFRVAMEMVKDGMNAANFLGPDHELAIEYQDTACCKQCAANEFVRMLESPQRAQVFGIVGPACSGGSAGLSPLAMMSHMSLISGSAIQPALSDRVAYPNFWRTATAISTFAPMFVIMANWGWKKAGVVWGLADNFQGIWDDTKNVARALGLSLQVAYGAPNKGEAAEPDERLAQLMSKADAIPVAQTLLRKRVRSVLFLLYDPQAKLLQCAQNLLGAVGYMWFIPGWYVASWGNVEVDLGEYGLHVGSTYKHVCPKETMGLPEGAIILNHMDWHPKPSTPLSDCGLSMTAGEFRTEHARRCNEANIPVKQEAGTFSDAVCMYGKALRELIVNKGHTASSLLPVSKSVYDELQTVFANLDWDGIGGRQEYSFAKADLLQHGAGDRHGPMIIRQWIAGAEVDIMALDYPYKSKTDMIPLGKEFVFFEPAGKTSSTPPVSTFPECDKGTAYNFLTGLCDVLRCGPGSIPGQNQAGVSACMPCSAGKVQGDGQKSCDFCAAGTYSQSQGSTSCTTCGAGNFSNVQGATACASCSQGTFAASTGLQTCERCPVGTYTSTTGTTECVSCQTEIKGSSTLFQGAAAKGDCKCMKGSYDGEVLHNTKSCVKCDEGLQCDEAGLRKPYQAKGYYIDGANTKAVYLCSPPEACEGGDWAASVCRAPRTGFLCMTCPKGLTLNSDLDDASAEGCKECAWISTVIVALAPIVAFCCLLAIVCFTHHNALDDNPVFTEAQNTIGQLIMFVQVTNACFSTRVKYGEPMLSFMDKVFAQIDPDKVLGHAPCLSEFMKEPVTQYGITIISPMIMIGCLFAAYFISLFGCNGKLMFDGVFNVVGEVLVEFYISVTLAIFGPFDCYDHPNGARSVQKYPMIICGEGDHGAMMVFAVIGILAYPVNAICVSMYFTWQLPRSMAANANDLRILIRCHFLFGRWKPETCWFCNVTIIRNFFIAVFPMIMPADQLDVTIILMIMTLMTALVLTVWFKPRRNITQNVLDTFISVVQLIIMTFGLTSVYGQSVSEPLSGFLLILLALVVTVVMSLMVLKAFQLLHPAGKKQVQYAVYLCHHAGAGGAAARVLHSMLLKAIRGRIFYDIDNLPNDTKLIDSIKVSNNLVVVFGSETLCRTWCIGAIVAAYRKLIPTQTVIFTDPLPEETVCGDAHSSSYVRKSFGASSTKELAKSLVEVDTTPLRGHGVDQRFAHPAIDALMKLDPILLNLRSESEMKTNFQAILDTMPYKTCERGTPVDVVVSLVFRPATTLEEPDLPGSMLILIDHMDGEAVAVSRLMRAVFSRTGTCLQDQDIAPNEYAKVAKGHVETAMFLFTERTLTCGVQLSRFALLWKNNPSVHVVPVVVGLTFDFPDKDYLSDLQCGKVLALGSNPAERLASFAGDMVSLKTIADSLTHVMTFLVIFINVANLNQVKLDKAMADAVDRVHNKRGRRASFHGQKAEALEAPEPAASQKAAIELEDVDV